MQDLMKGKRGLIMGIANDHSIAWGVAKAVAAQGADLASTYQGEALGRGVKPLAQQLGVDTVLPCDVEDIASVDAVFEALRAKWGHLDFLVHAIGFSDKNELKGRYADTTRANFSRTMVISCFSFTELAKRAAELMPESGGSMITLTFGGSVRVMPNYNVMGVAKAALEASVRYLAADFGPRNIRVNAVSAGPIRTLAGSGIGDARAMFAFQQKNSPLGRGVTLVEDLRGAAPCGRARRHLDLGKNLDQRRLDAARREEQPLQIFCAQRIGDVGRQFRLRITVGHIGADRGGLAKRGVAVLQRRHLAHRIDRQIFRRLLRAGRDVRQNPLVRTPGYFQKPYRRERTRAGRPVQLYHEAVPSFVQRLHFIIKPVAGGTS